MVFWGMVGALALIPGVIFAVTLLRGPKVTQRGLDLRIYRDQLAEVTRDHQSGKIPSQEAERLKLEISRRLLAADMRANTPTAANQPKLASISLAALIIIGLLGGGFVLYDALGVPGYPDLPLEARKQAAQDARANRPSQKEAEAQITDTAPSDAPASYQELVEKLRVAVAEHPDDLQGHILLARAEGALGNYRDSYLAQARVLTLKQGQGDAPSAKDYADLADMMVLAAGGYVSPEAENVIERALGLDPQNGVARFYAGLMMAQTGRPDIAFRMWDALLRAGPSDAPWIAPIRERMPEMAYRAGFEDYEMPQAVPPVMMPGPDAGQIADAQDMSEEDRQAMIASMVGRLAERLADQGGSPAEWARLISSLAMIGQTERAIAIRDEALAVFAASPQALTTIRDAAQGAGLAE